MARIMEPRHSSSVPSGISISGLKKGSSKEKVVGLALDKRTHDFLVILNGCWVHPRARCVAQD